MCVCLVLEKLLEFEGGPEGRGALLGALDSHLEESAERAAVVDLGAKLIARHQARPVLVFDVSLDFLPGLVDAVVEVAEPAPDS